MAKTHNPEDAAGGGAAAPAKKSMLGKLLVVVLVVIVVAVECVVAYLCVPTSSDTAVAAGSPAKPPVDHKKGEPEPATESEGDGTIEVDLKEYSVTVYQPASNSTLRIDFHLWGSVAKEKEKDFKKLFDDNQARFREQVVVTVRGAEMADLTDPSLGLIKRTILAKAKTILGQPLLKEVIISDYSSLEN